MPSVRYSSRALADLREIGTFIFQTWGESQAEHYLELLEDVCALIGEFPRIGRAYPGSPPNWRRLEHESHVILYSTSRSFTTIQRIQHKNRLLPPPQ